jgi:hypothetical protein
MLKNKAPRYSKLQGIPAKANKNRGLSRQLALEKCCLLLHENTWISQVLKQKN